MEDAIPKLEEYRFFKEAVSFDGVWKWKGKYPNKELPTEEGIYLTFVFTSGMWRYPRLYRIWRGPKSGRLYCYTSMDKGDTGKLRKRNKIEDEFFNICWVKIEPPDEDALSLGGEWYDFSW